MKFVKCLRKHNYSDYIGVVVDAMSSKVITPEQEKNLEEILDENAKRLDLKNNEGK